MKAKELFGKLGYKKQVSFDSICFVYENEDTADFEIIFDLKSKKIHTHGACSDKSISIDELNAIYKQCGELGWIEEEKQEIKKETNFEHYYEDFLKIGSGSFGVTDGKVKPCYYMSCSQCDIKRINNSGHCRIDAIRWLASPYRNSTYKLTQCEYDMLDTIFEKEARFSTVYLIGELKKKGYFENIKCDSKVLVKDILANCEVIE